MHCYQSTISNAAQTDKRVGREKRPRKNERNFYTCNKMISKVKNRIVNPAKTLKQIDKIYISNINSALSKLHNWGRTNPWSSKWLGCPQLRKVGAFCLGLQSYCRWWVAKWRPLLSGYCHRRKLESFHPEKDN